MIRSKRRPVNKHRAAKAFRRDSGMTHKLNTPKMIRRGGIRL